MSTATIPTRQLVGLLADLLLTASTDPELPALSAVLLHSDRGEWAIEEDDADGEPLIDLVPTDLLVGTSTNRYVMGQAHVPAEGQFHRAVLISASDAKAVVSVFKPLVSSLGREITHRTVLELAGDVLTATEDPRQVPAGLSVHMPVLDTDGFPAAGVENALQPDPTIPVGDADGVVVEPSYGTGINPVYLHALATIGKRRKMLVAWYRHHQSRAMVAEVGAGYRCVIRPAELDEGSGQHLAPQVRVFAPPVPVKVSEAPVTTGSE